jgi:hypothetical protein
MTAMTKHHQGADTTMMGVVHDALRRDLVRLRAALAAAPPPDPGRRAAIAGHAEWMMGFLHRHHRGEDEGLWPLVRQRDPQAAALLDRMEADHLQVVPASGHVSAAADRYRTDPGAEARTGLLEALDALAGCLLPHLRAEENEAMPLVSAVLSDAEWRAWDHQHNVKGKSLRQLAADGHWLMDSLDRPRYQVLIHLVPPPARLLIVKGFARRYRTACALLWGPEVTVKPLD